jgi:hypothetical protein
MTFYVLTAASMKMAAFWDIAPCRFIEVYQRFGGAYSLVIAMVMEVVRTSETLVCFNEITRRYISQQAG